MNKNISTGDWKRVKELGSGGFGVVSLWVNKTTETFLAVKMCRWTNKQLTDKQTSRWIAEVEKMKNINHSNIVSFKTMPDDLNQKLLKSNVSKLPILTMEYCSMGSLRDVLLKPQNACGFLECDVVEILSDTTNGLMYLHDLNITHRDFKPDNVVLQSSAARLSGVIYKIIDLGYAKELDCGTVSFVGTLQYLAPEMFKSQKYTKSVDYWSLGITAFEIMCGFRPFLHAFPPFISLKYAEQKEKDIICIQKTHTGDIIYSSNLLEEHRLSTVFKQKIVEWLRLILQYNPEERGIVDGDLNLFQFLHNILATKIITVFSVYTVEYYSYEVTSDTLFSTLQEWIAEDIKLNKDEFFIISTQSRDHDLAIKYYDETNREAMLYVYKIDPTVNPAVYTTFPNLINVLFEGLTLEFRYGTLGRLYAQIVNFVMQQHNNCVNLNKAGVFLWDHLKIIYQRECSVLESVTDLSNKILFEINFYNKIEQSLIEIYQKRNRKELKSLLTNYKNNMQKLWDIVGHLKQLQMKQKNFGNKIAALEKPLNNFLDSFDREEFEKMEITAHSLLDELNHQHPDTNTKASPKAVKVVAKTATIRSKFINNNSFRNYLKCATNYCNELNKITNCLTSTKGQLDAIVENLREIEIEKIHVLINCDGSKVSIVNNAEDQYEVSPDEVEEFLLENPFKRLSLLKEMEENYDHLLEYV